MQGPSHVSRGLFKILHVQTKKSEQTVEVNIFQNVWIKQTMYSVDTRFMLGLGSWDFLIIDIRPIKPSFLDLCMHELIILCLVILDFWPLCGKRKSQAQVTMAVRTEFKKQTHFWVATLKNCWL